MTSMPNDPSPVPKVTVLMPVYNAARYLREALDSVLSQTFADFELLIVDDASSDASAAVIRQYHDRRIRLVRNDSNLGVAGALNRGIELARGRYLARMDADDICHPERLERQAAYLDGHPEVSVIAAQVELIGAGGEELGVWQQDREAVTWEEIRHQLPAANCLAHPSVMMRREVLLNYGYHAGAPYAQDYELWLRLAAKGCRIEKLAQPLLKYRVHQASVTWRSNQKESEVKNVRIKALFLSQWFTGRLPTTPFIRQVIRTLLLDLAQLATSRSKGLIREALVRGGMLCGSLLPLGNRSGLFFFFPFYHVGGAERVHAEIVKLAAGRKPCIVITNRSGNAAFKEEFGNAGRLLDLSGLLGHLVCQALLRGYLAASINRSGAPLVFGSNTPFYYTLLPYLRAEVRAVDLIHAFGGIENVSLPHAGRLDRRIVIDGNTLDQLQQQYRLCGLPPELAERVDLVPNKVFVPAALPQKEAGEKLRVLYVGRGTEEKRAHLVGKIASLCHRMGLPVEFTLVGDLQHAVPAEDRAQCRCMGELTDPERIREIYRESDLLLLTSSREGFPLVIMEAMAQGVVPAATDVGGIGRQVINGENGFLIDNSCDQEELVRSFANLVRQLHQDRSLLRRLSVAAHRHALAHFSGAAFDNHYRSLFGIS